MQSFSLISNFRKAFKINYLDKDINSYFDGNEKGGKPFHSTAFLIPIVC
jgi:hypothetical protein